MAYRIDAQKNALTLRLRELGGLIRVAGDIAVQDNTEFVQPEQVFKAQAIAKGIQQNPFSEGKREPQSRYEDYYF